MRTITDSLQPYLENIELCDFTVSPIIDLCDTLKKKSTDETILVKNIYDSVNDEIRHTADTNEQNVTCSAFEVISYRHGICCAKANLFAACLRYCHIPAGFCYQKLKASNGDGFVLHGLNAVYLGDYGKWIRLDAGGVKRKSNARFSVDEEKTAYLVNISIGESDHDTIFATPNPIVIEVLKNSKDMNELWKNWDSTLEAVFNDE